MVQGASQPWGKNLLGRGKCLWPYIQAPSLSHSLSTFSMATFASQTALLMVLAGQTWPCWSVDFACSWCTCLDTVPPSCPSHSCHRALLNSHLFLQSLSKASQLEGLPPLSEVLEHLFGTCWPDCLTWVDTALLCT